MPKRPFVILLIDDDLQDAALFTELALNISPDLGVYHTSNGREALAYLERRHAGDRTSPRPDLMVLDLNMPVMNGHAFLQEAKHRDYFQMIHAVVLSVSTHPLDIQRSYHNYTSGYLVKPESFDDTKELIQVITAYWQGTVTLPTVGHLGG